jgi:hypothetical protein
MRRLLAAIVLVAVPVAAGSWGTLAGRLQVGSMDETAVTSVINDFATDPTTIIAEIEPRKGPHAMHQFVVVQAYGLLARDPAFADGKSGLPTLQDVNAWDGNIHTSKGMAIRPREAMTDRSLLAPVSDRAYGPGADAEVVASGKYNAEYRGAYHYWNPWLKIGGAPEGGSVYYGLLVNSILDGHPFDTRAHYASYMCHYIADVASAKHADAVTFDEETFKKLQRIAGAFNLEDHSSLNEWFDGPSVQEAIATIEKYTRDKGGPAAEAYWRRVRANVGSLPFRSGTVEGYAVDTEVATIGLNSAVAAFLHSLGNPDEGKGVMEFYNFFDPFYYNGPVFTMTGIGTKFELATVLGDHLTWETNPLHMQIAREFTPVDLTGEIRAYTESPDPKANYVRIAQDEGSFAPVFKDALPSLDAVGKRFVTDCSAAAHGAITETHDFDQDPQRHLRAAIRHVATALRASITALRLEATTRGKDDEGRIVINCRISNVADEPAQLKHVSVFLRDANGLVRPTPLWTRAVSGNAVRPDKAHKMVIRCAVPDGVETTDLVVDVRAKFDKTPDLGWRRAEVQERSLERITNPGEGTDLNAKGGPTDVIVVLDTTSSMGRSIEDLKNNAYAAVTRLAERTTDLRVALVTFNDLEVEADKRKFTVHPFSTDYRDLRTWFNKYGPTGGGDTPEDQLHGLSLAIGLWEKEGVTARVPTKIIVTITDAPAKSPDIKGNTFEKIGKRAFDVDPAHIYPIVVGADSSAMEHAKELAELTGGEVLSAKSGDEVADALTKAVTTAVATHGAPVEEEEATPLRATIAFVIGALASLFGAVTVVRSLVPSRP